MKKEVRRPRRVTFPKPITEGNLPLGIKYKVKNQDGSISTVRTISIGVDGGEVVIPTVLKGKVVSDEEAIAHYEQTGANFGTFRDPNEAKAFSEWLHNKHEREMRGPETFPADFNPIDAVKQQGFIPTSGYRTQAHQDALRAQGLTKTRHSSHTRGDAVDFAVPDGMSKEQAIAIFKRRYPGAKVIASNGSAIHATFPGWGKAPDVSGSRKRYGN